jgi:protein-disulfide isomerase
MGDPGSQSTENSPELALEKQSTPAADRRRVDSNGEFVRFKRTHLYAALVPLAFVAGLALGFVFWGRDQGNAAGQAAQGESVGQQPVRVDVSLDDDPSLGPASAPITIVEFSDFNCPYCKKWEAETFYPLLQAYPDQIHFVYRDFPITTQESFIAAQAADCAGEQGAYWKFHDALLSGELGLGRAAYSQYADALGIDSQKLLDCIDSERYADEVEADARYAAGLGVSGTPTFFINGIPLVGAQPLEQFKRIIDSELQ